MRAAIQPVRFGSAPPMFAAARATGQARKRLRVRHRTRDPDDPAGFLAPGQAAREGRIAGKITFTAYAAPCVRDAFAQPRGRPARGAAPARPCRHLDDADLHARGARAAEGSAPEA